MPRAKFYSLSRIGREAGRFAQPSKGDLRGSDVHATVPSDMSCCLIIRRNDDLAADHLIVNQTDCAVDDPIVVFRTGCHAPVAFAERMRSADRAAPRSAPRRPGVLSSAFANSW